MERRKSTRKNMNDAAQKMRYKAIVIGVSAGGFEALTTVISKLKPDFPVPVVIVQHQSPDSDGFLPEHLSASGSVHVKEAEDKEPLVPDTVYIAPPDYHLLIEEDCSLSLSAEEKINYARPAIDVLFDTAADVFGPHLIGIVLTGANSDGALGLKKIKEAGGFAIVQDPKTAYHSAC